MIIPGSTTSAYQDDQWIVKGRAWLNKFYENPLGLRILRVCFGQQVMTHTLEGRVDMIEERKKNPSFYITQVEDIRLYPELFELKFMKKNCRIIPQKISISEFHGDEVVKLPEQFICLGKSPSCEVEVTFSKDERYFGMQGHPEFSRDYQLARRIIAFAHIVRKEVLTKKAFEEEFRKNCGVPEEALKEIFASRKMTYDFLKFPEE